MKKIIANLASKPIVKGILKAADSALLGGLVHNIKEGTKESPSGSMDVGKAIGALVPIILLILLGMGVITVDQVLSLAGLGE